MRRDTLLDFFDDFASLTAEFLVHDDGYRTRHYRYADVGAAARAAGHRLDAAGLGKGDCAILWGENRPGWIIAFWACLLRGVVVVPVDYRATPDFLERVARAVDAKLLLVGDEVERRPTPESTSAPVWRLSALEEHGPPPPPLRPVPLTADDVAEIIFAIEEKFDIEVPYNANDTNAAGINFETVGDVVDGIAKLVAKKK